MKRSILLPKNTPSKVASKDKHNPCPASTTIQIIYFLFPIHTVQKDRLETWISSKNPNGLTERYAPQNPRLQTHQKNHPLNMNTISSTKPTHKQSHTPQCNKFHRNSCVL